MTLTERYKFAVAALQEIASTDWNVNVFGRSPNGIAMHAMNKLEKGTPAIPEKKPSNPSLRKDTPISPWKKKVVAAKP